MKIKRTEGSQERTVLIGMITDRAVLGAIASRWSEGMFSSRWGNLIASWCVDFFQRYKKAPGKNIEGLFDHWANEATRDKETVQLIERFLSSLSGEYQKLKQAINPDYTIDLAGAYFTKVKQKELSDSIAACLEEGDIEGAEELISKYGKIQIGGDLGTNVLEDEEAIRQSFEAKCDPLIVYKHGLGTFYGDALERDGLVSFMGPEKRGKTWALLDVAWQAMLQGRKVAFFEVGDLSKNQILRRFMIRASRVPGKARIVKWPTSIFCEEGEKLAIVEHEEKVFEKGLDYETAFAACQRILQKRKGNDIPLLKLSVHPNSSISIYGIQNIIDSWERIDWIPDVVVIDYADILAPPKGVIDSREQINMTWKMMRSLSQSLHCLVVTATQAKASSYTIETMGKQEFSEDKRKLAHATGIVGLNATNKEKALGIMRYNWIVLREEEYSEEVCCHVATCLPLGNPAVCSFM